MRTAFSMPTPSLKKRTKVHGCPGEALSLRTACQARAAGHAVCWVALPGERRPAQPCMHTAMPDSTGVLHSRVQPGKQMSNCALLGSAPSVRGKSGFQLKSIQEDIQDPRESQTCDSTGAP